jgi:hypothetical protein
MKNRLDVVLGVLLIAVGFCVLYKGGSPWALRGLAEAALGSYLIYTGLEIKS